LASRRYQTGTAGPAAEPTRQQRMRPTIAPPCGDAAWPRCSALHALPECRSLGGPRVAGSVSEPRPCGATDEGRDEVGIWEPGNLPSPRLRFVRIPGFQFSTRPAVDATARSAGPGRPPHPGPHAPGAAARGALAGRAWRPPWRPPARPLRREGSEFAVRARRFSEPADCDVGRIRRS
jgi:hypothetical protein